MSTHLPEPLPLFWRFKPLSSASAGVQTLKGGRKEVLDQARHPERREPKDARLVVRPHGRRCGHTGGASSRYRVWHPLDHVYGRYVRRAADGSTGPGAQIALCEYLGRNPAYKIEAVSSIEKLDETGFIHKVIMGSGIQIARMEHVFTETVDSTRDENCLIVPGTPLFRPLARLLVPRLFSDGKGQA
jgi:hypothetical protein